MKEEHDELTNELKPREYGYMDVIWAFLRDVSVLINMLDGRVSSSAKRERIGGR